MRDAERKLIMLHRAATLNDLRVPPANRLEALKAERKRQRSIGADTALRLARYFGMPVEFWTGIQTHYEVEMAKMDLADRLE